MGWKFEVNDRVKVKLPKIGEVTLLVYARTDEQGVTDFATGNRKWGEHYIVGVAASRSTKNTAALMSALDAVYPDEASALKGIFASFALSLEEYGEKEVSTITVMI